jgi:hypothetical protein
MELPYNLTMSLLGIHLKECKSAYNRDTCTPMFIAVQFTIAKVCNQPRYPTTHGWTKKMWYVYTMEYYSAIKKNGIVLSAGRNWDHHTKRDMASSERHMACFCSNVESRSKNIL